jgi:hypothetical protein
MRNDPSARKWVLIGANVVLLVLSVPLILERVGPNGLYGFRTAATLRSTEVWYAANAFMGWALLVAVLVSITFLLWRPDRSALHRPWVDMAAVLVPLLLAVAASFAYLKTLH